MGSKSEYPQRKGEPSRSHIALYDLASDVMQCHSSYSSRQSQNPTQLQWEERQILPLDGEWPVSERPCRIENVAAVNLKMQSATDAEAAMIGYVQKEKSQMDYREGAVEWSRQSKECRKKILLA